MSFFSDLLTTPNTQLGRAGRFAVFQIKLWTHCAKLLRLNRAALQAAALAYRTIFGMIPMAIVMLLIFRLFPASADIGSRVKTLIYDELQLSKIQNNYNNGVHANLSQNDANNSDSVFVSQADINDINAPGSNSEDADIITPIEYIDKIVNGFFNRVGSGSVTVVSLLIVIWAATALLTTIEKAFNSIWHVPRGRNFLQRIINYWALLTLGPILLGVGVYIASTNAAFTELEKSGKDYIPAILSYFISVIAFFLLYFVLPNTKVNVKPAIWGAAVAGIVWAIAKWIFRIYITKFIPYNQVYGMLGLVPLSVFWIYISWLIVLFGLQLTYTTQHLKTLDADEIASAKKDEEYYVANDMTAINIVREIAFAFQNSMPPLDANEISSQLKIPIELVEKILQTFVRNGIIVKTSEPLSGYVLARDPENIRLSDISQALASIGFAQTTIENNEDIQGITQAVTNALSQYNLKQILITGSKV